MRIYSVYPKGRLTAAPVSPATGAVWAGQPLLLAGEQRPLAADGVVVRLDQLPDPQSENEPRET